MLTITTRLTLWFLGIFGGIIVVVAVVMYALVSSSERAVLDDELRTYAELLGDNLRTGQGSLADVLDQLDSLAVEGGLSFHPVRAVLVSRDSVLFDNTPEELVNALVDSVRLYGERRFSSGFSTLTVGDSTYRVFAQHFSESVADSRTLIVVSSFDRVERRLAQFRSVLVVILPVALIAASFGGWLFARRALTPVATITRIASEVSSTSLDRRVPVGTSRDELSQLATVFNEMIARLERTFTSQRRFIADASHDIRTPITVMLAELELLDQFNDLPSEVITALHNCRHELRRLQVLSEDLLLLARMDSLSIEHLMSPVRLDELAVECVQQFNVLARQRHLSLRVTIDEPIEVICNEQLVRRAVSNVLDNAIKYAPEGTTVGILLEHTGQQASIVIRNEGEVISVEELSRLTDRFYRGDRARSTTGSGLGLAIVQSIIEAHGGKLALSSGVGEGMVVRLMLPVR